MLLQLHNLHISHMALTAVSWCDSGTVLNHITIAFNICQQICKKDFISYANMKRFIVYVVLRDEGDKLSDINTRAV